jgi:hypothetical protein
MFGQGANQCAEDCPQAPQVKRGRTGTVIYDEPLRWLQRVAAMISAPPSKPRVPNASPSMKKAKMVAKTGSSV